MEEEVVVWGGVELVLMVEGVKTETGGVGVEAVEGGVEEGMALEDWEWVCLVVGREASVRDEGSTFWGVC